MDQPAELLGNSPGIDLVRRSLRRLVDRQREGQRLPAVLIQGDTGSGKGLVARMLHRQGGRAGGPFVDVNCAAIPETLLEAELFGFERGAFTDAHRAKPGLFQAAHKGVLFLDEIGLLPDILQAKLLSAIEDRAVRRLGSTVSERVDAWLISATNTDLKAAVRERKFREDLYHRLAVVTIDLPPLRDRGRDILLLAERFLARTCEEYRLPIKRLASAAQDFLLAYSWPGNVRELANVIERAALFADGAVITTDALGVPAMETAKAEVAAGRDELAQQRLLAALEKTGWNISHTAARLGVSRNTVYARLEKFGLKPDGAANGAGTAARRDEPAAPPAPNAKLRWEQRAITLMRVAIGGMDTVDAWSQSSGALEAILAKVQSFGGRLEELSPTGLVAAFGLDGVDDAPRCAARAALAIHRDGQRAREHGGPALAMTIGLHIASVLIGRLGPRIEISAEAKRVHWPTLERLIGEREPDETVVTAAAEPFLERRFELKPFARDADHCERVYRLTGRERHGLGLWGVTTRFVGRQDELAALQTRFGTSANGHGQVMAIVGEAGVGKSRLVFELTRSSHIAGALVLQASSVSNGTGSSDVPVADLLRRYFRIEDRDTQDEIRDRVVRKLAALDPALQGSVPAMLTLMDIHADDPPWLRLDPSQRRTRTFDALKRLLRRESEIQPILVVFEDLHWIDAETQALLDAIVASVPIMRVLLVVTYRPEYRDAWASQSYYTLLRVDPLPVGTTEELLLALLGDDASLQPLKGLLADRTAGNPLFIEESVRTLVETGVLRGQRGAYTLARSVEAIEIPQTVQAILAARIDRLPAHDKPLLETAAVIGREVPFALLHALAEDSEDVVRDRLGRLQMAELLYETPAVADAAYRFKHALTHQVAYGTVPPERRRALHARIAATMERMYAGRLSEHVERLAHHSVKAELWESATQYLGQAGMKAAGQHALRDAVSWLDQALRALSHVEPTRTALEQAVDIRLWRMPLVASLGDYRVMQSHLEELEDLAHELADELRCGYLYRHKQNISNHAGRLDEALVWGARALDTARRLGERPLEIVATMMLEQTYFMRGEHQRVIDLAYTNLAALGGSDEHFGTGGPRPVYAGDRGWLVRSLAEMGRFREAAEPATTAREVAERLHSPYAIGWASYAAASLHNWMGRWDLARAEAEHGSHALREAGWVTTLPNVIALSSWLHARLGKTEEALTRARDADSLLAVSKTQARISGNSWSYFWLCRTYLLVGQLHDAERIVERVLDPPTTAAEAYASYLRAEIAAHPERLLLDRSEQCYRRAITLADDLGMRPLIAICHIGLARLLERTTRSDEAREQLGIATVMCRELDMEPWLSAL